jgi:hypothetical protein
MHVICYALLSAIHLAAAGFAVLAGAVPEAACAALAALVYAALAATIPREPGDSGRVSKT